MQSSGGDITAVMGIDDSRWVAGVMKIQGQSKQLGQSLQTNLGGGLARSAGQIGFAMQDFTSVLAMGGQNAMGRAMMSTMNNVQMLGAAFGPLGMAVTAFGGAIGSILIPKLLETDNAAARVTATLKEQFGYWQSLQKAAGAGVRHGRDFGGMDSVQLGAEADRAERESRALMAERRVLEEKARSLENDLAILPAKITPTMAGMRIGRDTVNPEWKARADELKATRADLLKLERDSGSYAFEAELRRGEADAVRAREADEKRNEAFHAAQKKAGEESRKAAEQAAQLWRETRTPLEQAQLRFGELERLAGRGALGPELAGRVGKDILDDFRRANAGSDGAVQRRLDVAQFGTKESFSDLIASINASKGEDKAAEQVGLLRGLQEKVQGVIDAIKDAPQPEPEGI